MTMSPRLNGLRPTSSGRTSTVPSPRPWLITGWPLAKDPRRDDAGAVRDEQDARGQGAGVDHAADQALRRSAPACRRELRRRGPAEKIAKRRGLLNEEPTIRPVATGDRLRSRSCSAALSSRFS